MQGGKNGKSVKFLLGGFVFLILALVFVYAYTLLESIPDLPSCGETDSGWNDFNHMGSVYVPGLGAVQDYCFNSNRVIEYGCVYNLDHQNWTRVKGIQWCDYGCYNDVCNSSS